MDTNISIDIRVKLAILWIARMLCGLQGDSTRLHDPIALKLIIEETGDLIITPELLFMMSIIFVVPILMSIFTVINNSKLLRWINLAVGIFFAVFDLVFLVLAIFMWKSTNYEIVWSFAYLICTSLIVWFSLRWPKYQNN